MALAADGEPRRVVPAVARPVACTTAAAALEGGDVESRADCDDASELRRLTRVKVIACERIASSPAVKAAMAAEEMLNAEISRLREEAAAAKATAKTASDNLAARLQALYGMPAEAGGDEGAAAEE